MINISDNDKAIWRRDSLKKQLTISIPGKNLTLGNADILWEKLELTETLENEEQLTFTGCNASRVKFEIVALAEDIRGEYIEIKIQAAGTTAIPLFAGYVESQERPSSEDLSCKITAYDKFYSLRSLNLATWYEGLTFPITLANFRAALATACGLEVEAAQLIFDTLQLQKTISTKAISPVDLWKSICMINGVYGRINRSGKLQFLDLATVGGLFPAEDLYPADDLYPIASDLPQITPARYKKIEYDKYTVDTIDKVQIREDEDDSGGIYGTGSNAYIVEGNWITFGRSAADLASMAQQIYNKVKNYFYMPAKITAPGLPYMEPGDLIESHTAKNSVVTYILQRTLKGIQVLEDTYIAEGSKSRREPVEDVHYQYEIISSKTNKLTRTVEGLSSVIYDSETGASRIDQNAQAITAKVSAIGGGSDFSWSLQSTGFEIKAGTKTVFKCDKDGITVDGYATAKTVNGLSGRIDTLETNSLTASNINSKTFTLDSGHIGNLDASKITSGTISTDRLDVGTIASSQSMTAKYMEVANWVSAGYIKSGKISADSITTALSSPDQGTITCGAVRSPGFYYYTGGKYKLISSVYVSVGGSSRWVMVREA